MKTQNFKKVDLILKGLEKFNLHTTIIDKTNNWRYVAGFKVRGLDSLIIGTRGKSKKINIDEVFSFHIYPPMTNFRWNWSGFFSFCKKNGINIRIYYEVGHFTGIPNAATIAKSKKCPVIYEVNIDLQTKAKKPANKKPAGLLGGL